MRKVVVVEVCNACNLMPKDGEGSASAYVQVEFEGQSRQTSVKRKDLNPVWNEPLEFTLASSYLESTLLELNVYNSPCGTSAGAGRRSNFLGRVRIWGCSIVPKGEETLVYYPLEKRGLFSHIKGELGVKLYFLDVNDVNNGNGVSNVGDIDPNACMPPYTTTTTTTATTQELPTPTQPVDPVSVNSSSSSPPLSSSSANINQHSAGPAVTKHCDTQFFARRPPVASPLPPMQAVDHRPYAARVADYLLRETRPSLAATCGEKVSSYDLVEKMQYLYVRVLKARGLLPNNNNSVVAAAFSSVNPFAIVSVGRNCARTRTIPGEPNPVWNEVFAFEKQALHGSTLEILLLDENTTTNTSNDNSNMAMGTQREGLLGVVAFDLQEIPTRVPPDSPLAPQWYRLENTGPRCLSGGGNVMLAVWMGTQADELFTDAWQPDTGRYSHAKSKVYLSPKLWYLRVNVIEAQDLRPQDRARFPEVSVRAKLGFQNVRTRVARNRTNNPFWNEDLLFVAAEPFEESLILTVEDHLPMNRDEILGQIKINPDTIERRLDHRQLPSSWFNLDKFNANSDTSESTNPRSFRGRIHLRLCLEGGYHVIDEAAHLSSDYKPTSKQLWKPPIGIIELGILGCQGLLPMKTKNGHGVTDAFCVAKYGPKWIRTRTIANSFSPRWNEQYTWDVFDPSTVLTVGVFDNYHILNDGDNTTKDAPIGKVRIRLSTLETERVYTNSYPLLMLHPSGACKKMGELELAIRFTAFSFWNVMQTYSQALLPTMHYTYPLGISQQDALRQAAMKIVALRMARSEPPLHHEIVQYMLDVQSNFWSMRRCKANWFRIMSILTGPISIARWVDDVCKWHNTVTTVLVHFLFLILTWFPELILPTFFFYMFFIGGWHYRFRPRAPPHMDILISHANVVDHDDIDEEFDTLPTSMPPDVVARRYDRLRCLASKVQIMLGDIASQGERLQALLSWRDPRATTIFISFCLMAALLLYVIPIRVILVLLGLYFLRHPRFREPNPPVPLNFFRRLPALSDSVL